MYRVVDYYEGKDAIGVYETREEAEQVKSERITETEGECRVRIFDERMDGKCFFAD